MSNQQENINRRAFISGIGTTITAFCGICMAACSKSTQVVAPDVSFTIDLSTELLNIPSTLVREAVLVMRLGADNIPSSFAAVQQACSHEGTPVGYNASQNLIICPLHGSKFTTNGVVQLGPASQNLKKYSITIVGSEMTVSG